MFALYEGNKKIGDTFLSYNDCLENAIYYHIKHFDCSPHIAGLTATCSLKKGITIKETTKES